MTAPARKALKHPTGSLEDDLGHLLNHGARGGVGLISSALILRVALEAPHDAVLASVLDELIPRLRPTGGLDDLAARRVARRGGCRQRLSLTGGLRTVHRSRRPTHRAGRLPTCPRPTGGLASQQEWEGSVNRHQPPTPPGVGSDRTGSHHPVASAEEAALDPPPNRPGPPPGRRGTSRKQPAPKLIGAA
jgi:hypothetical protein